MANQIIIDIGAVANDGTGDPLRTAFGYVNNNFSNVWATGVANSNISFSGNRILTTNTNGNLVLAPNGIGKIQANVDIVPNANNTLSLGSLARQWNTVYTQYLEIGGLLTTNDLTVDGNLTVTGNVIQIGNLVTDAKTIQLANTASTANAANGSGITVGANDNIATMLYSSTANVWTTNIGITATGNVAGTYFIGNGSLLTGITSYGNANVAAYLPTYTGNISANNVSANTIFSNDAYITRGTFSGDAITGDGSLYVGSPSYTDLGTDVMAQFTGNVTNYAQLNLQNYSNSATASGDYIITANNGNDSTHFIDIGITSSTWNGTQPNSLGNRLGPNDGYLYVQDGDFVLGTSNGNIETWKFGQDGTLTVAGDIVPTANNTQTLGTNTNRWSNLYLSGNTIYLGDLSLSAGADGLTSTAGFDLGNSVATDITANVLSANTVNIGTGAIGIGDDNYLVVETLVPGGLRPSNDDTYNLGNVSHRWAEVHANVYYGDGSQLTGLNLTSISNDGSIVDIVVPNGDVTITANSTQTWAFDTTGMLTVPGEGVINSVDDTVTLRSFNTTTGNANSVYLGSSGGLGFSDTAISGNWLEIFRNGTEPEIRVPVGRGNLNIQTAEGANVYNWTFDNTGNIQGNISLTGANIIINNAPGGAEGAELKWALPAVANTSLSGTVVQDVYASGMRFFESGGNSRGLTMDLGNAPNGTATAVGYRDIPQITLGANVTANATNAGRHFYSTTAGNLQITLPDNANVAFPLGATLTVVVNAAGNVIVAQGTGVSLYMAGSSSTGNRTVGAYGLASVMKVATDTWVISGTGVY